MLSDATGSGGGGGGGDKMVSSAVVHKSAKTSDEDDDTRHVVLVGDSTLDNLIWVNNAVKDCVVGALRTVPLLNVTNYACDGFTSTDVLRGNRPMLSATQWRNVGEPFPGCEESVELFKPLNALHALHAKTTVTHVVLSVGGNDVREILREMNKLSSVITVYHRNFREIVRHIRGSSSTTKERPQLIIMLQYRPSIAMDADGYGVYRAIGGSIGAKGDSAALLAMNQLMKTIYAPVLTLAKESNLPVIDLPRTFDPFDAECYRCQIEPSSKGSHLIAEMIHHVIRSHDFDGPSRMYSKNVRDQGPLAKIEHAPTDPATWTIDRFNSASSSRSDSTEAASPITTSPCTRRTASPRSHAVEQLMEMGFSEAASREALAKSGNLPQRAIEILLRSSSVAPS